MSPTFGMGGGGGRGGGAARAGLGPGGPRGGTGWAGERPSRGSRGRNLRGLFELLRPYRTRTAAALIALVLGTAAALAPPLLAKLAIDKGIEKHDVQTLEIVVVAFLVSAALVWIATYAQTYLVGWVGQRALADLRIRIFTHLQRQPIGFYESRPAGVLISRMTNDVEALESLVTDSVVTLFQSGLTLIGAVGVLLYLDVKLALLTFCVVPFVAALSIWFRLVSAGAFRRTRETIGAITGYLQETLSGIRVVRSFGQEPAHEARFAALDEDNRAANMVTVHLNATYFPAVETLSGVALALIVLYGGYQAIDGHITVGTIVAFVATLSFLFEPIQQLSQLYTTYQSGMAALEKIFQLLDVKPTLEDLPNAPAIGPIRGEVRFEDVSFAYTPRSKRRRDDAAQQAQNGDRATPASARANEPEPDEVLALEHIDLDVPAGQTIALVGATGAGKSTMAKLTARFYDPTRGRVLVDDHDLREILEPLAALADGDRAPGGVPVLGHGAREHRLRAPRRRRRTGARSRRGRRRRRVHLRAAQRLRDRSRRARRAAVGRTASADRVRARADRRPAHPDPRRGHLKRRPAHRGTDRTRDAPAARRAHLDRDRPPPLHHPPGWPHRRARARPHR